ncbi:uncharacterized protein LOC135143407 [Zophobas morio]|uniref:uncharacterized protein LOC135143407 n=1 Tax=Zophobas morio TaxID=2755281 RepID=UPI003082CDF9
MSPGSRRDVPPNKTRGRASVHLLSWHMSDVFSDRWKRSTRPLLGFLTSSASCRRRSSVMDLVAETLLVLPPPLPTGWTQVFCRPLLPPCLFRLVAYFVLGTACLSTIVRAS